MAQELMTLLVLLKFLSLTSPREWELMESLMSEPLMDRSEERHTSKSLLSLLHQKVRARKKCKTLKRQPIQLNGRMISSIELLKSSEDFLSMLS